ncbi:unnamed protein product [Larinioides sclopetarius]|uniref:Uncharacterized protein n=1 Tax=Larinioides sclopetarius TaxID=280406 RepID=A0AAV2BY96_9ARAC
MQIELLLNSAREVEIYRIYKMILCDDTFCQEKHINSKLLR